MCWGSVEYMVWYGWRTEGCFQHCVLALVPSLDTPILSIISPLAVSSSTGLACHRSRLEVPFRKFRVLGRGRGRRGAVVVRSVLCTVVPLCIRSSSLHLFGDVDSHLHILGCHLLKVGIAHSPVGD